LELFFDLELDADTVMRRRWSVPKRGRSLVYPNFASGSVFDSLLDRGNQPLHCPDRLAERPCFIPRDGTAHIAWCITTLPSAVMTWDGYMGAREWICPASPLRPFFTSPRWTLRPGTGIRLQPLSISPFVRDLDAIPFPFFRENVSGAAGMTNNL